jgi:hypothetical protein
MAVVIKATIGQKVHSQWARHVTPPELTYYYAYPGDPRCHGFPAWKHFGNQLTHMVIAYLDFDATVEGLARLTFTTPDSCLVLNVGR